MKSKFFILSIAMLVLAGSAIAQGQLRAGINLANVSVDDEGGVDEAKRLTSYQVGFIADVSLGGNLFSLQPGILFTGKGSKVQNGTEGQNGYFKQTTNPMYIEVPVTLVAKAPIGTGNRVFAGVGPYLGVGVSGKNKTEGQTALGVRFDNERNIEFSDDDPTTLNQEEGAGFAIMKRFDYGLNGTAGIEGQSIVLSVNYGLGLAKLQSGANNVDNSNKHRVLGFTLGFKL
jgi:hypothetical protein